MRAKAVAALAALLLVAAPATAGASRLEEARAGRDRAEARLARLQADLIRLEARYAKLERVAGRVALRLLGALRAERAASDALDAAQQRLDDRVRAAYELGPGSALEAFLSATSVADLLSIQEFTSRTIAQDATAVEELREAEARLVERRAAAERARAALAPRELELGILLSQMRAEVSAAERLAARAGLEVAAIEEHRRTLEDAAVRRVGRNLLASGASGATGADQEQLLALLGPSRGQGCEIPEGLVDTGKRFSGLASWYGWEFAGQSTANGAIFDPRLFTAANRWLPFGTFLRVHYRGECAIVLVNDRGPYGDYARVIDLSMAAAHYLGVGVSPVTADILVPA